MEGLEALAYTAAAVGYDRDKCLSCQIILLQETFYGHWQCIPPKRVDKKNHIIEANRLIRKMTWTRFILPIVRQM